jgi:hypothetical protein
MDAENLAISWHHDTLRYAIIQRNDYSHWVHRFKLGEYVYLQWITLIMLDVIMGHVILHLWKLLPSNEVLLLEGWDG